MSKWMLLAVHDYAFRRAIAHPKERCNDGAYVVDSATAIQPAQRRSRISAAFIAIRAKILVATGLAIAMLCAAGCASEIAGTPSLAAPPHPALANGDTAPEPPVTIAHHKLAPADTNCATILTLDEITQATGLVLRPRDIGRGCQYEVTSPDGRRGLLFMMFFPRIIPARDETETSFEGNTARVGEGPNGCSFNVALTNRKSAPFRQLSVTLNAFRSSDGLCDMAVQITSLIWDRLPEE
jgi:hypothetical protein